MVDNGARCGVGIVAGGPNRGARSLAHALPQSERDGELQRLAQLI